VSGLQQISMIKYIWLVILAIIATAWTMSGAAIFKLQFLNLPLIIGLVYLLLAKEEYLLWGFIAGLILDIFSPFIFGSISVSLLAALILTQLIIKIYEHSDLVRLIIMAGLAVLVYHFSLWLIIFIASQLIGPDSPASLGVMILGQKFWLDLLFEFFVTALFLSLGQWFIIKKRGSLAALL